MSDLASFLLARTADDKSKVLGQNRNDVGPDWTIEPTSGARVLAECEAKRRIVAQVWADVRPGGSVDETILRHLALPYADHPDYRPEWRP